MRLPVPPSFNFLFRTDEGRIDRRTWRRGTLLLAVPLLLFTLGWVVLLPWTHRNLDERALIDLPSLVAYVYLLIYTFVILLVAVSFYNLSAKRWRDRGRPPALAGLLPLTLLIAGAAHWLEPRSQGAIPFWVVPALDGLVLLTVLWTAVELCCLPGQPEKH